MVCVGATIVANSGHCAYPTPTPPRPTSTPTRTVAPPTQTPTPKPTATPGGTCGGTGGNQCPSPALCFGATSVPNSGRCRYLTPTPTPTPIPTFTHTPTSFGLAVTFPTDGASLRDDRINVRGTYKGPDNTGITVNGAPAFTATGVFVANHIPLASGSNTITAKATLMNGSSISRTITVASQGLSPELSLNAVPEHGIAPLDVAFGYTFDVPGRQVKRISMDFDGNGQDDFSANGPATLPGHTYTTPGVYVANLTVTDDQNTIRTANIGVEVVSTQSMDARLQAIWNDMKAAIRVGDVDGAVTRVATTKQEPYRTMITALGTQSANIDTILTPPSMVELHQYRAEYQMIRIENGIRVSYFVLFVQDDDGVWRLKFY